MATFCWIILPHPPLPPSKSVRYSSLTCKKPKQNLFIFCGSIHKFMIDWPVLQFFLCHIAFLQWSQHPSQFSQSCHPIWFHSQTWWHFLHQSSGKTLKDTIQDVSTRWISIIKKAPTYSTKQKPHGVLVNLSSPMMILLTSPHLPNNS